MNKMKDTIIIKYNKKDFIIKSIWILKQPLPNIAIRVPFISSQVFQDYHDDKFYGKRKREVEYFKSVSARVTEDDLVASEKEQNALMMNIDKKEEETVKEDKCYDCKNIFKLSKNWTIDNVTFKDNLEVVLCDNCMEKYRGKYKEKDEKVDIKTIKIGNENIDKKKEIIFNTYITESISGMRRKLKDDSVRLFLVDPPYNLTRTKENEEVNDNWKNINAPKGDWDYFETEEDFFKFTEDWVKMCYQKQINSGSILIHATIHNLFASENALKKAGYNLRQILIWYMPNCQPSLTNKLFKPTYEFILWGTKGDKYVFNNTKVPYNNHTQQIENVLFVKKLSHHNKERIEGHPTQKPTELLTILIKTLSNEGELVSDCFLGSGSTMLACKKTNRHCDGFEMREECVSLIRTKVGWNTQGFGEYKYKYNLEILEQEEEVEEKMYDIKLSQSEVDSLNKNCESCKLILDKLGLEIESPSTLFAKINDKEKKVQEEMQKQEVSNVNEERIKELIDESCGLVTREEAINIIKNEG